MTIYERAPAASELAQAATGLIAQARSEGWSGPDPYDALWGRHWRAAIAGGRRRRQAWIQLHARAPVNIRPVHRRRDPVVTKALAAFGLAATRVHRISGDPQMRAAALEALGLLFEDRSSGPDAWGYPFPVQTRWSYYRAGTPNVVVTGFAVTALTEAADAFGVDAFADRARRAGIWVHQTLFDQRRGIFVYHPASDALIHNANMLGARAVHQSGLDSPAIRSATQRATRTTLDAQRPDGSWPYGDGPGLGFVDSFHTGYVLDCLLAVGSRDPDLLARMRRGAGFYLDHFFGDAGEARLWPNRRFPEDAHSAGTGLSTIASLADAGVVGKETGAETARRVLRATLRGGHCIHRRYRWGATRVRYPRWCDAHVALGLASYALVLSGYPVRSDRRPTSQPSRIVEAVTEPSDARLKPRL